MTCRYKLTLPVSLWRCLAR